MQNRLKGLVYAALLGAALAVVGIWLMGYIAAIAIPMSYFDWFANKQLALSLVTLISYFFAYGLLALALGAVLGRISARWFLHSLVCYLAFLLYGSVGTAIVYQTDISPPFAGLTLYDLPAMILLPLCLTLSTYITAKKLAANRF